jgi:hypothetical protein
MAETGEFGENFDTKWRREEKKAKLSGEMWQKVFADRAEAKGICCHFAGNPTTQSPGQLASAGRRVLSWDISLIGRSGKTGRPQKDRRKEGKSTFASGRSPLSSSLVPLSTRMCIFGWRHAGTKIPLVPA